jgi:hypothetical protein
MTNYCDSEFIGKIIGDDEFANYCEDNLMIEEVQLYLTLTSAPACTAYNQTWNATGRTFSQILKVTDTSFIPITTEYNYDVIGYGSNVNGITLSVTKLDTSTIRIDWSIPLSSPEPIATTCSGYYTNYTQTTTYPPQDIAIWDVTPIIIVTEPDFNCEIARLFIYRNKNTRK